MGMSAARCQGNVREMSGNFRVSGEWSPCTQPYEYQYSKADSNISCCIVAVR